MTLSQIYAAFDVDLSVVLPQARLLGLVMKVK